MLRPKLYRNIRSFHSTPNELFPAKYSLPESSRVTFLERMRQNVKSLNAAQLYKDLLEKTLKHNKLSLPSTKSVAVNKDIVNETTKICILEGLNKSSVVHHNLACDVVEVLDLYSPSIAHIGYLKLMDICIDNKLAFEALEVFNRSQKFEIPWDVGSIESLIDLLSVEFRVNSILEVMATSKFLSSNVMISIANPLIMTGNMNAYSYFFSQYIDNMLSTKLEHPMIINHVIRSIVNARIQRVSSLTTLSEDEISFMDNILNDINRYHNILMDQASTTQSKSLTIPSMINYVYLCEIEKLIRDHIDLSQTTLGRLFLPAIARNSQYIVEDRHVFENHGIYIQDLTEYLNKEDIPEDATSRQSLLVFNQGIWKNYEKELFGIQHLDDSNILQPILEALGRQLDMNQGRSGGGDSAFDEFEDEFDDDGEEEDGIEDEYDDEDDEEDEEMTETSVVLSGDDEEEDGGVDEDEEDDDEDEDGMEGEGEGEGGARSDDTDDDDVDDDDDIIFEEYFQSLGDDHEPENTLMTQMNKLGKISNRKKLPLDVNDISASLQSQTPPIKLDFAKEIFDCDMSFSPTSTSLDTKKTTVSKHRGGGLPFGDHGGADDGEGGGTSPIKKSPVALEEDKEDIP